LGEKRDIRGGETLLTLARKTWREVEWGHTSCGIANRPKGEGLYLPDKKGEGGKREDEEEIKGRSACQLGARGEYRRSLRRRNTTGGAVPEKTKWEQKQGREGEKKKTRRKGRPGSVLESRHTQLQQQREIGQIHSLPLIRFVWRIAKARTEFFPRTTGEESTGAWITIPSRPNKRLWENQGMQDQ